MWLAPEQIRLATVSDDFIPFAKELRAKLDEAGLRVQLDDSPEKVGKKIRNAAIEKVPWTIVLGEKEVAGEDLQVKVFGSEAALVIKQSDLIATALQQAKYGA
jgi:threonyl-tRNA synthetase